MTSRWLGWVVVGIVVVGVIASLSDDDAARDASNNSQPDVIVDNEAAVTDVADDEDPPPAEDPEPEAPKTYLVRSVTDGDTLLLRNGDSVRLVGVDAPEQDQCGSIKATQLLTRLTLGERVTLTAPVDDRDRYGRLLRYVDVGDTDTGFQMIGSGLAIARYDSRDGYDRHPRQRQYVQKDESTPNVSCAPAPLVDVPSSRNCAPGYSPCIPSYPPDLDCADTGPVAVTGSDPHGLDADGDGVACGGD